MKEILQPASWACFAAGMFFFLVDAKCGDMAMMVSIFFIAIACFLAIQAKP